MSEVRNEVVLPTALVIKIQKLAERSQPPQTVSEFVERTLRSKVSEVELNVSHVPDDGDSEIIKARLKDLGYL